MWKKILWVYLGVYSLAILILLISNAVQDIKVHNFELISLLLPLISLVPAVIIAFELKEKKGSIFFIILGLFLVAVPLAGLLNFNSMDLVTIGKALFILPILAGLLYFGFGHVFHKKSAA
jgi:hypothetical protein